MDPTHRQSQSVHPASTGLALLVAIVVGIAVGMGGFTFVHAQGASYLTNDPAACANCHVMQNHFDAWAKSSHHAVAVCNDCHAPHDFFGKYWTKAVNGWHHSRAFTLQDFHEPIAITPRNVAVAEGACRSCHGELAQAIEGHAPGSDSNQISCLRCHAEVGHME